MKYVRKQIIEDKLTIKPMQQINRMQQLAGVSAIGEDFTAMRHVGEIDEMPSFSDIDSDFDDIGDIDDIGSNNTNVDAQSKEHSAAFERIISNLNEITNDMDDIKISEYKLVMTQIKSIMQIIRTTGSTSLQENAYR